MSIFSRSTVAALLLSAAPLAFAQNVQISAVNGSTPITKVYATTGGPLTFDVRYIGAATTANQLDLTVTYSANVANPVGGPSGNLTEANIVNLGWPSTQASGCFDIGNSDLDYATTRYQLLWSKTAGFPSLCGTAPANNRLMTFSSTVSSFPVAGSFPVTAVGNTSGPSAAATLTVCQKRTVTSVTTNPATEGAVITYTVNFDAAVPVGCGGFAVPGVLSGTATAAPDSVVLLTTGTCANVADSATSCTILAQGVDDTAVDGTKVATLTITDSTAASNYVSVGKTVSANVLDNESSIAVALGRNGAEGGNSVQFAVTCNGPGTNVTVNYAWSGTATAADFTAALPTSTTFAACNGATQTVDLAVADDTLIEGTENVTLTISTPTANVALVPGQAAATATIADNDALPSVAITKGADCAEPATNCAFTVTVTSNTSPVQTGAISGVSLTLGGTATPGAGNDYSIRLGACPAGGTELTTALSTFTTAPLNFGVNTVNVCVIDDLNSEGTETVTLQVNTNAAATATTVGAVSLNITDDDGPQTVSVAASGSPAEQGAVTGKFTLTRVGGSVPAQQAALTVNVTLGGSATYGAACTAGVDYMLSVAAPVTASLAAAPRTVTFPAGNPAVLTADVTVTPCDDTVVDPAETVTLAVAADTASPIKYNAASPTPASLTIIDNDIGVSVSGNGATEGSPVSFVLTCTGPASSTATVTFAISGQDAGATITPAQGPVTVTCGTPTTITVSTVDDATQGNNRSVGITLSNPVAPAVIVGSATASASVADNDAPKIVPTMSMLGLGFMSLMLAGFVAFQRRRMQK